VILSPYAFAIEVVFVVLIAAATAYAVARTGRVVRRSRAYDTLKLPSELPIILGEFQQSIERLQDEGRRAAKVDEAMVSALGPIELALQDFSKRIIGLEKRTDENESQLTELKSMLVERQTFSEGNARAIERSNTRLEELDRQSTAAADQLSGLKQMTESAIAQQERSREELRAINGGLAALQAQLTALVRRVHFGETGQKQLSELAQAMAKSVAALEAGSQETAQRIAGMEPRILWRIEHLETLSHSALAGVDQSPAEGVDDGRPAGTKASSEE
jgi:chromosome segregation ATPase